MARIGGTASVLLERERDAGTVGPSRAICYRWVALIPRSVRRDAPSCQLGCKPRGVVNIPTLGEVLAHGPLRFLIPTSAFSQAGQQYGPPAWLLQPPALSPSF